MNAYVCRFSPWLCSCTLTLQEYPATRTHTNTHTPRRHIWQNWNFRRTFIAFRQHLPRVGLPVYMNSHKNFTSTFFVLPCYVCTGVDAYARNAHSVTVCDCKGIRTLTSRNIYISISKHVKYICTIYLVCISRIECFGLFTLLCPKCVFFPLSVMSTSHFGHYK